METEVLRGGAELRRILDTISGGLLAVDANDTISFCNGEFVRYFGLPAGRTSWVGCTHDDALAALAARMPYPDGFLVRADDLRRAARFAFERVATADGRTFERDYLPMSGDSGQVWHYWDITDQHLAGIDRERRLQAEIIAQRQGVQTQRIRAAEAERTQQDLAERNRLLIETDLRRKELLATASHELRTPLSAILNFTEMLADDAAEGSDEAQFTAAVTRNATRMLSLVDDLLLLARIGSGAPVSDNGPVDLTALVGDAVADARATSGGVVITADLAHNIVVTGSAESLARAVANVLGNAVKYSHEFGAAEVTLRSAPGGAELVITDHGIGIPADEVDAVFGQFYRATTARDSGRPGTGLGLSIVRSILEQHGGTVSIRSVVGAGTVATITLPG